MSFGGIPADEAELELKYQEGYAAAPSDLDQHLSELNEAYKLDLKREYANGYNTGAREARQDVQQQITHEQLLVMAAVAFVSIVLTLLVAYLPARAKLHAYAQNQIKKE